MAHAARVRVFVRFGRRIESDDGRTRATCAADMTRVSQCSAGSHKPRRPGATPGPATCWKMSAARYANRKSGQVESLVCVGSSPTLVIRKDRLVVGHWLFEGSGLFPLINSMTNDQRPITNDQFIRSRRLTAKVPGLHPGDGGSIPSGTTARRAMLGGQQHGPVVQWEDACLASKRSGFDSRWVH